MMIAAMSAITPTSREQAELIYGEHLSSPIGLGERPQGSAEASAGSPECGNKITFWVATDGDVVGGCGWEAAGCQTLTVAASMITERWRGEPIKTAALTSAAELDSELGGLSPLKREALEITLDAAAVALGRSLASSHHRSGESSGRILVAMSGGVDSSTVALMLRSERLDVWGVTVELWRDRFNDERKSCCSASAVRAARAQAHSLGIPHITLDLREQFRAGVVDPFIEAHVDGMTPNPCVRCNGSVRFDAMLDMADRIGACEFATGHYARIERSDGRSLLRVAADPDKDQSYTLAALSPEKLSRIRFPLGEMRKSETREIAASAELTSADKPDSQDLCFLAGTNRAQFLARHGGIEDRPGEIVRSDGSVIGSHPGTHLFTVGQRRGIGIASDEPLYVLKTLPRERLVVVGERSELIGRSLMVRIGGIWGEITRVRLRYHSKPIPCSIEPDSKDGRLRVTLNAPAEVITPGQVACFMSGELITGHGIILRED